MKPYPKPTETNLHNAAGNFYKMVKPTVQPEEKKMETRQLLQNLKKMQMTLPSWSEKYLTIKAYKVLSSPSWFDLP